MNDTIGKMASEILRVASRGSQFMKYLEPAEDNGDYVTYRCKLCHRKVKEGQEGQHFERYHKNLTEKKEEKKEK